MSLEFAEKVRGVRESLRLNQQEFAELLGVTNSRVSSWETSSFHETKCWDRVLQFLVDCPESAVRFLLDRPWDQTNPEEVRQRLLGKLGWTNRRMTEALGMYPGSHIHISHPGLSICTKILLSLLEVYAEVDQKDWPAALHFETTDIITRERARLLRLSLGIKQSQLGNLLHIDNSTISGIENDKVPGWCTNLMLRILETYPRAVGLFEAIPWDDEAVSPEMAVEIRNSLGLTQLEFSRLLDVGHDLMGNYEKYGLSGKKKGCAILVYKLLRQYPEEFLSYVQGLSSPGGQACPIW